MSDTFFDSGGKCIAMVTAYYDKRLGEKLWIVFHIFEAFQMKFGTHVGLEVYLCKTLFGSGVKCVAMVTAYYGKKLGGKLCRAFPLEFGLHGNSAIPPTCTFGGTVYCTLRNLQIHLSITPHPPSRHILVCVLIAAFLDGFLTIL